jgi:F-type H+-transporting ATPase subunit a
MEPSTANVNTNMAMAVVVFVLTHYYGMRVHGLSYLKHFLGPVWWLSPLMLPIELIGHFARLLSLSIRLFGNMFADHMVVSNFLLLVAPFVPVVFMGLGVLVCVLQAFIFSMLSAVYFSMAIAEEH